MYVGFAVSLVRRLVFNLVPCCSSGACGFAQLTLPQVGPLGFLPFLTPPARPTAALVA